MTYPDFGHCPKPLPDPEPYTPVRFVDAKTLSPDEVNAIVEKVCEEHWLTLKTSPWGVPRANRDDRILYVRDYWSPDLSRHGRDEKNTSSDAFPKSEPFLLSFFAALADFLQRDEIPGEPDYHAPAGDIQAGWWKVLLGTAYALKHHSLMFNDDAIRWMMLEVIHLNSADAMLDDDLGAALDMLERTVMEWTRMALWGPWLSIAPFRMVERCEMLLASHGRLLTPLEFTGRTTMPRSAGRCKCNYCGKRRLTYTYSWGVRQGKKKKAKCQHFCMECLTKVLKEEGGQ